MDRIRLTLSSLDELRHIRADIRLCNSLDLVRQSFERLQEIRRQHSDDFDLQIVIADAQQEVIERARYLRKQMESGVPEAAAPGLKIPPANQEEPPPSEPYEGAEIPEDVPKLHRKSWQLAVGLAILFTAGILASFFYLVQTARRLNFGDTQGQAAASAQPAHTDAAKPLVVPPVSSNPNSTLRLYTDLTGGTVTMDDETPKDLGDGELDLDSLTPGQHNVKVEGRGGSASFSFALDADKEVPRVTQVQKSTNAMVVLVSVKDGTGRLSTDAAGARVVLDGKLAGEVGGDSLLLADLGNKDHDLEVSQAQDKQKFVLTYTPAPTLTVFVKSDPSIGIVTVAAGQDGVSVFINDLPYRRLTEHGSVRIPLKVGSYRIRVHQIGFQDPPEALVEVKKSAESSVGFRLQPVLEFGTLIIKGAQPGTAASIDQLAAATVGPDGTAKVVNIKPGEHEIELHHDQAVTRQLTRSFTAGQTVTLSGADVLLDHLAADNKSVIPAAPGPPVIPAPQVPPLAPAGVASAGGEQVHKGGGFIPYHTPRSSGHYYFEAHAKVGGVLNHHKLQWYAGYQDSANYLLFSLDGKHAEVKEVRNGKQYDVGKIPFNLVSDQWVQIEMTVKPDGVQARAKSIQGDWTELTPVPAVGRDLTKATVGMFVPANDEMSVANFKFSAR